MVELMSWCQTMKGESVSSGHNVMIDVMVEAANHPWLHLTYTVNILKVFEHIEMMLWMSSWVNSYSVPQVCMTMSSDFSKNSQGEGEQKCYHDVIVEATNQHW